MVSSVAIKLSMPRPEEALPEDEPPDDDVPDVPPVVDEPVDELVSEEADADDPPPEPEEEAPERMDLPAASIGEADRRAYFNGKIRVSKV